MGYRVSNSASLTNVWNYGNYWSAVPFTSLDGCRLFFNTSVNVTNYYPRAYGIAVRPVQE